ncbi:MAG: ligase-associated DNA damage response DEXH box helicase, partial [Planctomycetota bacterium]
MTERAEAWFAAQGRTPFAFQREAWDAYARGESGLIHAPTGVGKTLAAWLGPLLEEDAPAPESKGRRHRELSPPLRVLWLTPVRALAADLERTLGLAQRELAPHWSLERRTGDSSSAERSRQKRRLPTALITTPESLSLQLSYPDAAERFASLRCVVVDEWHELLGTKRGVQTELGLARLRSFAPGLRTWGLSATLGNLDDARRALLGPQSQGVQINGDAGQESQLILESLLPARDRRTRFPWAGHLGLHMWREVAERIAEARTSLVFTNTRAQAERWYQALRFAVPEWSEGETEQIALHHGSVDRERRGEIEARLSRGELRSVVCTSSLDLGVDFPSVDLIVQVGSPKGVARLMQRAGRSGHSPGVPSRMVCVPTHALELIEFAAARRAIEAKRIESRPLLEEPLDVLAQHLVTVALGGGFIEEELAAEVRSTATYANLTEDDWRWVMNFVSFGGEALREYDRFARVFQLGKRWVAGRPAVARMHRLSIGTIVSDGALEVRVERGSRLGTIEESFLAKLSPGDRFVFAGKLLELVRVRDMTAVVRRSKKSGAALVSTWMGGRMPLSTELAQTVRESLPLVIDPSEDCVEWRESAPLFETQTQLSAVPKPTELLIERHKTREGHHVFLFPLEGRRIHEGLATLLAWRIAQITPMTITQTVNDWGLELLSSQELPVEDKDWPHLLSPRSLEADLLSCVNETELAKRKFREVARVAGLIHPGLPGRMKGARQ